MEDKLYIIDQHAAHEKVLYERIVKEMKERNVSSQVVSPPIIISLNLEEQEKMKKYQNIFKTLGFEIESFGGREYSIRAVPQNLFGMTEQGFLLKYWIIWRRIHPQKRWMSFRIGWRPWRVRQR